MFGKDDNKGDPYGNTNLAYAVTDAATPEQLRSFLEDSRNHVQELFRRAERSVA